MYSPSPTNSEDESSDDSHFSSRWTSLSDATGTKSKLSATQRLSKSMTNSKASSDSDSSSSASGFSKTRRKDKRESKQPPVGIFWDIENCQVPRNKSASAIVQRIREFFLVEYREAEFLVVCDVKKESPQIVQELHDAQVNLIHVASTSKNAADEKLRQSLRRFAEVYQTPSCVILISSDINFASDLSDLRYRKKIHVILVHNTNVADALILCANKHYCYSTITEGLPQTKHKTPCDESAFLIVSNLPLASTFASLKTRLKFLTNNCGGKVVEIQPEEGVAFIKFNNQDSANRAQRRIQGEDVFGNKIKAVTPSLRSYTGRRIKGADESLLQGSQIQSLRSGGLQEGASGVSYPREQKRSTQNFPTPDYNNTFRPIKGIEPVSSSLTLEGTVTGRRGKTPQESSLERRCLLKSGPSWEYSDDGKMHTDIVKSNQPVDLTISNLDPAINVKELKRLLAHMLKEYAMILSLNITLQSDGTPIANLKVNNQQAAQYVISQLHRQKLGYKRIIISCAQNTLPDPQQLKAMVISILQEAPDNYMPLFKFIELLESRYHCTISVSELNKLKDICKITDNMGSRIISFSQEIKQSPPPNLNMVIETLVPYCTIHCANNLPNLGWCEFNKIQSPNVMMPFKLFTTKLNRLVSLHLGCMPLLSFQICYEHEFHEPLPVDGGGVPLEHLIACVPNIEIKCSGPGKNIKFIKQEFKNALCDEETILKDVPPALASSISLFCRELVDLLKTTDKCQLLLSKFVPAYHHHFGRQCHVADYGYTKLLDLFESIPHIIQVMGDGTRKVITLSHPAQMRRFTSDLLRVLKVQPLKQITVVDYPSAYEKILNKRFNPVDYGLCLFEDLVDEIPDNIIVMSQSENGAIISIPKKEQTVKEIMRTKQFAMEVIDILKHSPNGMMLFNKFIPAYHHHFGHQCRVSYYGFSKLIELFEAIPGVVKIRELSDGERAVILTLDQSLRILSTQILNLIKNTNTNSIPLDELERLYLKEYGYSLQPQVYECETVPELVEKLDSDFQLLLNSAGTLLISANSDLFSTLRLKVWALLLNPPHSKEVNNMKVDFKLRYNSELPMTFVKQQLRSVVTFSSDTGMNCIILTDLYVLAAQLYYVLFVNGGSVLFNSLEWLYKQYFGKNLKLLDYDINSVDDLYEKMDFLFFICGYKKNVLTLNRNLAEYQVTLPIQICNPNWTTKKSPQPVAQKVVQPVAKKLLPPKPDSPPSLVNTTWNRTGNVSLDADVSFSIQLPITHNPQLMGNPYDLISPVRHLFPHHKDPWQRAPDPQELPMPDKLLVPGNTSNESNDSGVNSKIENSHSDAEAAESTLGWQLLR